MKNNENEKINNKHDANDDNNNDDDDDKNRRQMFQACGEWKSHLLSLSSALNTQMKSAIFIYIQIYCVIFTDFNQHCNYLMIFI